MDQNTKKFCDILDKLGNQLIEIVNFYNEAEEIAEVVLESNYEDTCYHTNITINDDLTATINQERKDNLTEKDFSPDDYYPMGIDGISESKSWNLSKYEVSLQLTEIILPRFEEFLVKIKDGFKALQKLKLDNSTSTEVFGMLKHLHDVGVSLIAKFKKHESTLLFVRDLKIYFSDYCELTMLRRRIDEFKVRMGIEPVEQKSKKAKKNVPKTEYSLPLPMTKWAVILGVSENTLRNLRKDEKYHFDQVSPRKWRLPRQEIPAEYLEKYRQTTK